MGVENNKIKWSGVIAYTNNTNFKVDCANYFKDKNISDKKVLTIFNNLIRNEYIRKPMKEYSYLAENITLGFWWQVLIFVMNVIISVFVIMIFLKNDIN